MKSLILKLCFGLLMATAAHQVFATCSYNGPTTGSLTTNNLVIPSSMSVGATIPTTFTAELWGQFACTGPVQLLPMGNFAWNTPLRLAPGFTDVWATGYPGIGVRFHLKNGGTLTSGTSADTYLSGLGWSGGLRYFLYSALSSPSSGVELVKTGAISTGTVSRVLIGRDLATNVIYIPAPGSSTVTLVSGTHVTTSSVWLQSFNVTVTSPTCSFQNTEVPVPLGDVNRSVFTGVGTASPWHDFGLVSAGCSNVNHVYMKFAGTPASGNNKLFAVTGGATGVGVDIQTSGNQQAVPNGTAAITFSPLAAGASYGFKARYMQTQAAITAGNANATATVSITYD